jgi:hypothetical protein
MGFCVHANKRDAIVSRVLDGEQPHMLPLTLHTTGKVYIMIILACSLNAVHSVTQTTVF